MSQIVLRCLSESFQLVHHKLAPFSAGGKMGSTAVKLLLAVLRLHDDENFDFFITTSSPYLLQQDRVDGLGRSANADKSQYN